MYSSYSGTIRRDVTVGLAAFSNGSKSKLCLSSMVQEKVAKIKELTRVGFEPTPGNPDQDLNLTP